MHTDHTAAGPEAAPETRGVKILLGDPKKAIVKLALPMIFAMVLSSIYNVVDRFWVSGLGQDALSATGYYFPLMLFVIAFATGLGVGGGASVSQFIGARRPERASSAALHTLVLSVILAAVFTLPLILFSRQIFTVLGARSALDDAMAYGNIMFGGTIFLFFTSIAAALLRGEGSATKSMISIASGALLNVGLDPLFIYGFKMGVAGAAWASVLSMALSSLPLVYWLFIEKKSYLRFKFRGFRFEGGIISHIAAVGVPAVLMQGAMAVQMFLITMILAAIGKDRAVAVFTAGWTVVQIAIMALIGMGTAVTSTAAAAFGAREYGKLAVINGYAFKVGLVIACGIALLTALGAPLIALLFAWSPETRALAPDITAFLQIIWIFYPATAGGLLSSALFQGVRKGSYSLVITIFRTIVFAVPFAFVMGIALGWGATGVYAGLIAASWFSSLIAFFWARAHVRKLIATGVTATVF
jgi:putative MATE family efflux protein